VCEVDGEGGNGKAEGLEQHEAYKRGRHNGGRADCVCDVVCTLGATHKQGQGAPAQPHVANGSYDHGKAFRSLRLCAFAQAVDAS
jgi:hypothetical protein